MRLVLDKDNSTHGYVSSVPTCPQELVLSKWVEPNPLAQDTTDVNTGTNWAVKWEGGEGGEGEMGERYGGRERE